MLVVGLTGGIGTGKSTVATLLGERGAVVIDVDALGRDVIAPGGRARDAVVERFGTADRVELAARVFADPDELAALEAISHPAINAELDERLAALPDGAVVVLDMAILVESDLGQLDSGRGYTVVVTVEAPLAARLERLVERGLTEADARARMANQATDAQRRAVADHVIVNDGDLPALERQVDALWHALLASVGGT